MTQQERFSTPPASDRLLIPAELSALTALSR